jgi:hypothetical protein
MRVVPHDANDDPRRVAGGLQRPGVEAEIGAERAPERVVLQRFDTYPIVITAGSILFPHPSIPPASISLGLNTFAILVIVPAAVTDTFTGILISGKLVYGGIGAVTVHEISLPVTVHAHGLAEILPMISIHSGSVSLTVVIPETTAGHSFLTAMT